MRSLVYAAVFAIGAILPLAGARGDDLPADRPLLKGSVTIYRDTWGVPHIFAKTPGEGAYGLGYVQAQDRLDDIYKNLRTGLGRMAEAFGGKKLVRLGRRARVLRRTPRRKTRLRYSSSAVAWWVCQRPCSWPCAA
jgi:acyl-homoserine lactone acylase PvdQ